MTARQSLGLPEPEDGGSFGRDVRLIVGAVLTLGNLVLVGIDTLTHETVTAQDLVLHGGLLLAGLLLIDPKRTLALLTIVKDKLPVIGKL